MFWGRSTEPSKFQALLNAEQAFEGFIQGKEKAYMVEAAIKDVRDAMGHTSFIDKATEALKLEGEESTAKMFEALQGVIRALKLRGG